MKVRQFAKYLTILTGILPLSGCITERTVTQGGQKVEQGLVVKRPLKEALENSR
ncbi:hypothetical protein [Luteolibacter sp. Populi]|uniref:hypothetical protein n=1 Tax=Luteolibacter sp. Populi TaxID=3230487 RepID=UPI003466667A